ncbi:MAG: SRPBCC domain-containing protein [Caldilineaceae bacterium]
MTQNPDDEQALPQNRVFHKTITIHAPTSKVWAALTEPALMKLWMAESEIEILTDWRVGAPFIIRGNLHKVKFENRGVVLQFEVERLLKYTHLSSISRLPDQPENHSIFEFQLTSLGEQTSLALTASNFATDPIYRHLAFYWNVALGMLKKLVEEHELRPSYTVVPSAVPE